ncbi:hypothetical protein MMC34_002598 [Xylographa carneopallida]|nr:hypothetical protein [Xylographa carneopallida]
MSEFLRVASPSTSWIDIDEHSDRNSSTSASQEEELPDIPQLSLGSPLVPVPSYGLFNVYQPVRVVKMPFFHRIPERAPSFENLERGCGRPDLMGRFLRTLDSNGRVTFIPFTPVPRIQYNEPGLSTFEELVELNQDSPLVLHVKRSRAKGNRNSFQRPGKLHCNDQPELEAEQPWCNAVETILPPPALPTLTRSQLGENLARLRSKIVRLRSDMIEKQHCEAHKPEQEQDNIIQITTPLADTGLHHPCLHRENATFGHHASGTVYRPCSVGLTTDDRQCDVTVVNKNVQSKKASQFPGYDRDNVELGKASIHETCPHCQNEFIPTADHHGSITSNQDFHIKRPLVSPAHERESIELGDASMDAACQTRHAVSMLNDDRNTNSINNGISHVESLSQFPGRTSDIVELGRPDIGRVYRPRRVGFPSNNHRREGIVFDQDLYIETLSQSAVTKRQITELTNHSLNGEPASLCDSEGQWTDYSSNEDSPETNPYDLVVPPTSSPRNAEVADLMTHSGTRASLLVPEDSAHSANTTGTAVVYRLRRRRGMVFDASVIFESRNVSSGGSATLCGTSSQNPVDVARTAYNHDLALAMLEGRVRNKVYGSLLEQIEHLRIHRCNGSISPITDPKLEDAHVGSAPAPAEHLRSFKERAKSSPIDFESHDFQARRRLGSLWFDEIPDRASALPLAIKIPDNPKFENAHVGSIPAPPQPLRSFKERVKSSPIDFESPDFLARRRLEGFWVDEIPDRASAPPLATKIPANPLAAEGLNKTMPTISFPFSSKVRRSPKTWLREKAKRITRMFR